jgi:GAF domain-containing protein
MAFGLLFVLPSLGFINFAYKYNFFTDHYISYYFLFVLVFSYLGFFILRTHADRVRDISENVQQSVSGIHNDSGAKNISELNRIAISFQHLIDRLEENNQVLELRAGQLRSLGEIAESSFGSADTTCLLDLGLQKACDGIAADSGWVLVLDESRRHHFTVACEVDYKSNSPNRMGVQIPFVKTRAKQAVIQRRPIFISDSIWQDKTPGSAGVPTQDLGNALVIPLVTSRDVFGVMCLENKKGGASFSPADLDFMLPLATCLSYRYENMLLQNRITLKADQFNCLSTLNSVCNQGLVRGKVFQLLVKELRSFMPVKISFLALFDATREYLELLEVASEEPFSLRRGMRLPLRQSLFNLVVEENREIHQKDVTNVLHPLEARWFQELGIDSCYLAPFRIQGVNAGILFVGSDTKQGFSSPQQVVLQQAGEYLGLAMHNQILLQQIDEQSQELEALNRIGNVLTSSLFDLDRVVDQVGTLVDQMIAVEAGAIYLREGNALALKKSFGTIGHRIEPVKIPSDEGICGYVASRGESVLVRDVSQNPHLSALVKSFDGIESRSILCVPLAVNEEVVGAIHLWNKESDSFTTHDQKLMQSVAASLAAAVASSRLHRLCERLGAREVKVQKVMQDQVIGKGETKD